MDQVKNYYLNGHASILINFHDYKILTVNGDKVYFTNDYDMFFNYLIVYGNKIVFLHSSFELNQNQLSVAVTKLQ